MCNERLSAVWTCTSWTAVKTKSSVTQGIINKTERNEKKKKKINIKPIILSAVSERREYTFFHVILYWICSSLSTQRFLNAETHNILRLVVVMGKKRPLQFSAVLKNPWLTLNSLLKSSQNIGNYLRLLWCSLPSVILLWSGWKENMRGYLGVKYICTPSSYEAQSCFCLVKVE